MHVICLGLKVFNISLKLTSTMFCKNLLQITPGGTIELDSFQEDEDKNKAIILEALLSTIDQQHLQDLKSPERLFNKNMTVDLNSRNPGLKR